MVKKWVTLIAFCTIAVGLGSSLAFSQGFTAPRNGDGLNFPAQGGRNGAPAIRAPQGDPPPLPGAFGQSTASPHFGQQPAAQAPRLPQQPLNGSHQLGTPVPTFGAAAPDACPFGSDKEFACQFESRPATAMLPRSFADPRFGAPLHNFREPPMPAGFRCEGGFCPLDGQFGSPRGGGFRP